MDSDRAMAKRSVVDIRVDSRGICMWNVDPVSNQRVLYLFALSLLLLLVKESNFKHLL